MDGNGWEWGVLGLLLIVIVDHSLIPYQAQVRFFLNFNYLIIAGIKDIENGHVPLGMIVLIIPNRKNKKQNDTTPLIRWMFQTGPCKTCPFLDPEKMLEVKKKQSKYSDRISMFHF
jgi:hypothetical protein